MSRDIGCSTERVSALGRNVCGCGWGYLAMRVLSSASGCHSGGSRSTISELLSSHRSFEALSMFLNLSISPSSSSAPGSGATVTEILLRR